MKIKVGTILKIKFLEDDTIDTVMIIKDITGGYDWKYMILDLQTKEVLRNFKTLEEIKNKSNIVKVVGQFDELFSI
ncbi:hypothetical protein [Clostridium sp.]|uniref:hypothetical protein n=1 Tax=Clostridium sp. TaxID=1506 RepID=UPI002619C906|nr:hypothetical protein [Clostridium sp.]